MAVSAAAGGSALCGVILGAEREWHRHAAGLRTLVLIALSAGLLAFLGRWLGTQAWPESTQVDPTRLASYVIAGIGFLGAGLIINRGSATEGLTTAASIWAAASLGVICGLGQPELAVLVAVAMVAVLLGLAPVARLIRRGRLLHGHLILFAEDTIAAQRAEQILRTSPVRCQVAVNAVEKEWRVDCWYAASDLSLLLTLDVLADVRGRRGSRPGDNKQTERT